jgi:hypothetical protein
VYLFIVSLLNEAVKYVIFGKLYPDHF